MQQVQGPPPVRAVTIPFADLKDRSKDLSGKIEEGLGRQGLGIVSIAGVPGYPELRKRLLRLAPRLVNLPDNVKKELEDPDSRYFFGWSHGKEKLENGIWDTFKGSYFANPVFDVPTADDVLVTRKENDGVQSVSTWCGWHTDYGTLTGLTCGLFTRKSEEIPCHDVESGLYVRTRDHQVVKVIFEDDELAYQIGETAEILSRGHLCATPHCVKAPSSENASDVDRSTFVLFIQPDWDEKLKLPSEMPYHQELIPPKAEGYTLTYGEYSERVADKYFEARA
ncbi:unnamed protein product [Urochloa decumbens]|uniref:Fe2OG dioxygenase domain-containing protein n=1 Tax=Urochloa decumbens TaxID=240449 RepID=A0ABC9GJR7_9POAL